MLTSEEVKKYAHMRRLRILDYIWKDYLQDMLLHLLYIKMPHMVFSGGTAIWKVMKGDRFSEDIDSFVPSLPSDLAEYLQKELSFFGVTCRIVKKKKTQNMLFLRLGLAFPSHPREIVLSLEILSASPKNTEKRTLYSPYPDIPTVDMFILSPYEMLANKISAIYGRNRPRDIHDAYLLLKLGVEVNMELIKKKVPNFSLKTFEKKMLEKEKTWNTLKPLIMTKLPNFKEEVRFILSSIAKIN